MNELIPFPEWDSAKTWETFVSGDAIGEFWGVELQKSVDDLARYHELIEISQPDVIIETGTRDGGSALWFRHTENLEVISIDLAPRAVLLPETEGIHWVTGSSSTQLRPDQLATIAEVVQGKRVMVSLDSDHHAPHVVDEIFLWRQFVTEGCYLVIEDACFDMWKERPTTERARVGGARIPELGGPLVAINEAQAHLTNAGFWRDAALETLSPISHSPVGWWRLRD